VPGRVADLRAVRVVGHDRRDELHRRLLAEDRAAGRAVQRGGERLGVRRRELAELSVEVLFELAGLPIGVGHDRDALRERLARLWPGGMRRIPFVAELLRGRRALDQVVHLRAQLLFGDQPGH
jgi:hypothetical protein